MFCMNCGQQLPDGAKFCLNCGTPQGEVSPTGTTSSETINLDGSHTFVPAMCPNCKAPLKVDSASKFAYCSACGTECLVQEAIKTLTVKGNVQIGNATINVSGTDIESLLTRAEMMLEDYDFIGAKSKCDTILDMDPTNGKAYLYLLMSDLVCRKRTDLANQELPFDNNSNYIKAIQYGDNELKSELQGYINKINSRFESKLKNLKVGDKFSFGENYGKAIWWKVFRVVDNMAFVICNEIICDKPYHQHGGNNTWADCTLRKWLNNEFIQNFFRPVEQERILPCKLNNYNYFEPNTTGGVPTTDKVFLLSIYEAEQLFLDDRARVCGSNYWWLRSPGKCYDGHVRAAEVDPSGRIFGGCPVINKEGVRPAMWIKI